MKVGIWQHHADIRHHWLGQDASDIARGKRRLKGRNVVELDDLCKFRKIPDFADQGGVGMG